METPARKSWNGALVLAAFLYFVAGVGLGKLAGMSSSAQEVFAWRLSAWILSAAVYTVHIWYEHFRLRNAPRLAALHVAAAVAVGAFLLAAAAVVNSFLTSSGNRPLLFLALVVWPILTGAPAFVVAFAGTVLLARFSRKV